MKLLRIFLVILLLTSALNGCINQEEGLGPDEMQPELSEEEFVELVNNILVEKVRLEMFYIKYEHYTYIRNTFDRHGNEISVAVRRHISDVHISISPQMINVIPQMIDTRGIFTPHIESQADLTPPSDFETTRTYAIEVAGYKGTLDVSRAHVSLYFRNIGVLSPVLHPGPESFISKVLYYSFTGIFVLAVTLAVFGILRLKVKKLSKKVLVFSLVGVLLVCSVFAFMLSEEFIFKKPEKPPEILQPELSEQGFIEFTNTILVEKVRLEMFDLKYEHYTYIRNTFDRHGNEISVVVRRCITEIHISINSGHFTGIPQEPQETPSPTDVPHLFQMIDTRGIFTPHIESQVDLTPPSDFETTRTYAIEVAGYKGTLDVSRAHVSLYFRNIGMFSPIPVPGPGSFVSQVLYYSIGIFVLVILLAVLGVIALRRRKKT